MSLLIQFLTQIRQFVRSQDADSLRAWLKVGQDSSQQYFDLRAELQNQYTPASLAKIIDQCLPIEDDVPDGQGTVWPGFIAFARDYFTFWRDVNHDDLLSAHQLLSSLVNSCATAFAHPTYGSMLLKLAMSLSETLASLTMMLNKRPDLTRKLQGPGEDDARKTVAETSAEIIQKIFTTCLTDRSSDKYSPPQGKRVGIYMFANLVLKLLFACRRTHLAKMIFFNLTAMSPLLSFYPASQRVTFLYYLGRFSFSNGHHYLRAASCLEAAYLQTPPQLISHRTNILTYLIPCNILLGRFPSTVLMQRPEALSLAPIFLPLCAAVRSGNFVDFQHHLARHEAWLLDKGLLLPLTHRLRPLLWRSLSRKTFLLTYVPPTDANSRKAATLDLPDLRTAVVFLQRRLEGWTVAPSASHHHHHPVNPLLIKAATHNSTTTLISPPSGPRKLRPNEGIIWGNAEVTLDDVEVMVATLIQQGLMHGFIAHGQGRFAIIGAKAKGPVIAGWPNIWQAIRERRYEEDFDPDDVPGWVRN